MAQVKDGNDVGVRPQASHRLGLSLNSGPGDLIQGVGLDQGEGHLSVQQGVVSKEDLFLTAFPKEIPQLVATIDKGTCLTGSIRN